MNFCILNRSTMTENNYHEKFPKLFTNPLRRLECPVWQVVQKPKLYTKKTLIEKNPKAKLDANRLTHRLIEYCVSLTKDFKISDFPVVIIESLITLASETFHTVNDSDHLPMTMKHFLMTICYQLICSAKNKTLSHNFILGCVLAIKKQIEKMY